VALIALVVRHHTMDPGFTAHPATKLVVGTSFVPLGPHVVVQRTGVGVVRRTLGNAVPTELTVSSR
jgi:hypothetical protein